VHQPRDLTQVAPLLRSPVLRANRRAHVIRPLRRRLAASHILPATATRRAGVGRSTAPHQQLASSDGLARPAREGDVVSLHYTCRDAEGQTISSSRDTDEPCTFELGAGKVFANPLFKAFDAAARGLGVGDTTSLECNGGEWKDDLLFTVERSHPEVERLTARYQTLTPGLVVELANGASAVVLHVDEEMLQLDANPMLAGKQLLFELELVALTAREHVCE